MRKRRHGGSVNEALQQLRAQLVQANDLKVNVNAETPQVPNGIANLSSLSSIDNMSDLELKTLQTELSKSILETEQHLNVYIEFQKCLKSAMDAALMLTTLKADVYEPVKKRKEDLEELDVANHPGLQVGQLVAFKVPQTPVDEWIQCEITKVNGLKFEVRDPEPDDLGNPGKTYQCRLKDIIPLPQKNEPGRPLSEGTVVLALYPETTAFYKAKVASYNQKRGSYLLRFEGEEDLNKEIEVRECYVLERGV